MPCSDSSSSLALRIDENEKFISFDFAKITCGREINGSTGFATYCAEKSLVEIYEKPFQEISKILEIKDEESNFILYLEWDALRCAIAQYLGEMNEEIDTERCRITSIDHTEEATEIAMVILPPKEMPKILPCSLGKN